MTKEEQIKELAEKLEYWKDTIERHASATTPKEMAQAILDVGYTKSPEIKLTLLDDKPFRRTAWAIGSNKAIKEALQTQLAFDEQEVRKQLGGRNET